MFAEGCGPRYLAGRSLGRRAEPALGVGQSTIEMVIGEIRRDIVMASRAGAEQQPLLLWAGCVQPYDLIERVDALRAGEFSSMSIGVGDVLRLERERG